MRALPAWLGQYVGLPYCAGGETRAGVDCWGLLALVWREQFGRELPPYRGPLWHIGADANSIADAAQAHASAFVGINPEAEQIGDGLLLRIGAGPLHIGMVVGSRCMLHAQESTLSCVERYDSVHWRRRWLGFYRPGAET